MNSISKNIVTAVVGAFCVFGTCAVAIAGSHTWESWAVFTNADGTLQFVVIKETHGGTAEGGLASHTMISHPSGNSKSMHNVTGNTAFTYYLLGTAAYAALPGAPPLDEIIPPNFIAVTSDTSMEYSFTNTATWAAGSLPTNGINMLSRTASLGPLSSLPNVATNYAGVTGCVDASGTIPVQPLPGVPDGTTGSPMRVGKLTPDGSSLSISWDSGTCNDAFDHQIIYGQKTGFPTKAGGLYTLRGAACGIGSATPYTWTPTPTAIDGSGLTWFLVVSTDGAGTEGPWGSYNGVNDRNGTGSRCASGFCGTTSKSLAGTCGH
jgi:hypothetical protein